MLGLPRRARRSFLRNQGLRPFTADTVTDLNRLDAQLGLLACDQVVVEHGEFRAGVACAAVLVPPARAEEPAWAIAMSYRGQAVPHAALRELALAASDLAGAH
jgi:DNA-binding IclR family transcriptional regulator